MTTTSAYEMPDSWLVSGAAGLTMIPPVPSQKGAVR